MNTRMIIAIVACLASIKGRAQGPIPASDSSASSPYVNVRYTNFRSHGGHGRPMFGTTIWMETVTVEMLIDDRDGAFEFGAIDTDVSFKLIGEFPDNRALLTYKPSVITFSLQDGSTFEAKTNGIERKMYNGAGFYQCTFGFSLDTNQLERFIKTGIKSGRLHTTDGYYNLKISREDADKFKIIARDFLRVYIKRVLTKH